MAATPNVGSPPDGATLSVRWPSDAEAIEQLRAHVVEQGRRFYMGNLGENFALFVGVLRKWSFQNGGAKAGHTSWLQIAGEIWPDVDLGDREDAKRKFASLRRWAKLAGDIGLLQVKPSKNKRGQFDGILWRLTWTPPKLHSAADADVAQLAKATVCGHRRRQETPAEREAARIRPWDRRGGQKVAKRFEKPPRRRPKSTRDLFFVSRRFETSIARPPVPTGLGGPGVQQDVSRAALAAFTAGPQDAAAPGSTGRNAADRSAVPLAETTAGRPERRRRPQRDRSAELGEALRAFERRFGRPSLPIRPETWELWQRAARRGELYGGWGVPVPGLALQYVVDRIDAWTGKRPMRFPLRRDAATERPPEPASIAYFVTLLDDASKHWRHAWRHEHGLCRRPDACRANAWMYPALDRRIRNTSKWVAYDREVEHVRRVLNDAGPGC